MPKITKTLVDATNPDPAGKQVLIWDTDVMGFGLRVTPGAKAYILNYRTKEGRVRRVTIGKHGSPWTADEARKKAKDLLREIEDGVDPLERPEPTEVLTVGQLCDRYLEAARAGLVMTRFRKPKRASTIAIDVGRVDRHIKPLIGDVDVTKLTRGMVQRMADDIAAGKTAATVKTVSRGKAVVTGGKGTAGRVVELLGGMWTWADKRELVSGPNPAHGVERERGDPKERTLTPAELGQLGAALRTGAELKPIAAAVVRLVAVTGLRADEARSLRWQEIDEAGSFLRLEKTKTGRSTRPIGKAALALIRSIPKTHDLYLWPNANGNGAADVKRAIADLFDAAGLPDARCQTLRRTFASTAAELGYSDATIAEMLGHARRGVTERHYVRRPDAVVIAAVDRVADVIAGHMDGAKPADVVPLPTARRRRVT